MKRLLIVLTALAITSATIGANAATEVQPKTEKQKLSYAVGVLFARNIGIEAQLDKEAFLQGVRDVLDKAKFKMSVPEMQAVMKRYRDKELQARKAEADKNEAAGKKFLAENAKKKGVVTLPSGVEYKVIKSGTGPKPTLDDTVVANYEGRLLNGKIFDSSYKRGQPATIPLSRVIKGWQEVLPKMSVGSKWEVYIPAAMAYGDREAGGVIGPDSTLIFKIELLGIKQAQGKQDKGQD
jgi:FKBP-type peptidyl-prolyl cis-trans isomerase FklB